MREGETERASARERESDSPTLAQVSGPSRPRSVLLSLSLSCSLTLSLSRSEMLSEQNALNKISLLHETLNEHVVGQALEAMNEALLNDILLHYRNPEARFPSSFLLSSLELSDTKVYEP